MKSNMGILDKSLRIIAALVIIGLYLTNILTGTWAIILLIFSAIFILTSFIGFCPLYFPFKFSTKKNK